MTPTVEKVAKAIARTVPIEGSRWNDGYGHDFPREYHEDEKRVIRGIARDAIRSFDPSDAEIERAIEATGSRWGFGVADARILLESLRDQALSA